MNTEYVPPKPIAQAMELRELYRANLCRTDDMELIRLYRQCEQRYGGLKLPADEPARQDADFYKGAAALDLLVERWGVENLGILRPKRQKSITERIADMLCSYGHK
ncbi:MAG: hypothetical protein V1729_05530 [Candidatus Woesearchaeota archaeon]